MRSIFAVAVAAVGLVSAANITDFNIDPQSVDLPERGDLISDLAYLSHMGELTNNWPTI